MQTENVHFAEETKRGAFAREVSQRNEMDRNKPRRYIRENGINPQVGSARDHSLLPDSNRRAMV